MNAAFDRYFFTPMSGLAPSLVARWSLILLGLDTWLVMLVHGGQREGDFNVAHFAWIDALQPEPSPAHYNGVVVAAGLLSFTQGIFGLQRPLLAVTTLLYTYGWAMSQLDSYQHHYLLSWFLLCFTLFPSKTQTTNQQGNFYAYRLIGVITAIVYSYTAISKSAPEWRAGVALERIAGKKITPIIDSLRDWLGGEADTWWSLIGHSVLVLQVVVAAAYLLRPLADLATTSPRIRRWIRMCSLVGMGAAVSFHVGAEYLGLRIGWFSLYMILLAVIYLAPTPTLERVVAWLRSGADQGADEAPSAHSEPVATVLPSAGLWPSLLLSIPVTVLFGHWVDIPGTAGGAAFAAAVFAFVYALPRLGHVLHPNESSGEVAERLNLRVALEPAAPAFASLAMWTSIVLSAPLAAPCIEPQAAEPTEASWPPVRTAYCAATGKLIAPVRFDYYRFVGGDLRRRGEDKRALEAYDRANLYAIPKSRWVPLGRDRQNAADQLRATLDRR